MPGNGPPPSHGPRTQGLGVRGGPSIQRRPVARRASAGAVTGSPCGAGRKIDSWHQDGDGVCTEPSGGPPARACHLPLHAQDLGARGHCTEEGGVGTRIHKRPDPGRRPRLPRAPRESAFLPAQLPQHPHLPSWRWGRSLLSRLAIAVLGCSAWTALRCLRGARALRALRSLAAFIGAARGGSFLA